MHSVPATEAKARFAELLRAVERGESFVITRHDKAVAHLVPTAVVDRETRRAALQRFRARRRAWRSGGFTADDHSEARHADRRA